MRSSSNPGLERLRREIERIDQDIARKKQDIERIDQRAAQEKERIERDIRTSLQQRERKLSESHRMEVEHQEGEDERFGRTR